MLFWENGEGERFESSFRLAQRMAEVGAIRTSSFRFQTASMRQKQTPHASLWRLCFYVLVSVSLERR